MSRLYIKTYSDMSRTGKMASEWATAEIRYGSASNSKLAGRIEVYWKKGEQSPIVGLKKGVDTPRIVVS